MIAVEKTCQPTDSQSNTKLVRSLTNHKSFMVCVKWLYLLCTKKSCEIFGEMPDVEELNSEERNLPECLTSFISRLLTGSDQKQYESTSRLIQSYSSDLVYGVTRGKVITAKHFLLGLGLYNITGQKKPVEINHRLGHSIDYNFVCEIETALAEAAQGLANENGALPVKPSSDNETVLTFFWADIFDMKVETQTGKGSIHSTHMVAFQELSQMSVITKKKVELERTKRRTLEKSEIEARNIFS